MNEMSDASGVELALMRHALQKQIPINGSFELTPLCNMDCEMCYVRLSADEMHRQGRLRTASEWLSLARQAKDAGTLFLLLTGGEPLLYPEFDTLYQSLRELGMILTINTNGTLIDEARADFFATQKPRRINLTLYGSDSSTYRRLCHYEDGFERACRAVRLLRERGVDVKIGCSAVGINSQDAAQIRALGASLGVPVHIDSYMYPAPRERSESRASSARLQPEEAAQIWFDDLKHSLSPENYRRKRSALLTHVEALRRRQENAALPPEITGMQCMAGNCSFTVNWQGMMRPCVMLSTPSRPVFETGFDEAWRTLRAETQQIRLNPKCTLCTLRPFCHICAASAYYEAGSYSAIPDYLCRMAQTSYDLLKGDIEDAPTDLSDR